MLPKDAGYLTLDEITKVIVGFRNKEERQIRRDWEIARWQIMHIIAPYSKKKGISSADITVFPWERIEGKTMTKADVIDRIEQFERWEDKHKDNG